MFQILTKIKLVGLLSRTAKYAVHQPQRHLHFFKSKEKENIKLQAVTVSGTTKLGTFLSTYIKLNFRRPPLSFCPPSPSSTEIQTVSQKDTRNPYQIKKCIELYRALTMLYDSLNFLFFFFFRLSNFF